jgi:cysteine desulfurase
MDSTFSPFRPAEQERTFFFSAPKGGTLSVPEKRMRGMTDLSESPGSIYLDYAATTPVDPRVFDAMEPFLRRRFGNPSSIHSFGQDALEAVEAARRRVAALLNADPSELVFTGGGTESDNAALIGAGNALKSRGNHVVTTAIEHHAVLACCEFMAENGFDVTVVQPGPDGIVLLSEIEKAVTDGTVLISVMHANNEIGTIQPVAAIGAFARSRGIVFHTDAVQTFGHVAIDVRSMNIDLLSLSAHKLYGPKGVGGLYIRGGTPFEPLLHGGGQEAGRRSSTHNVPGIAGLGMAAEIAGMEMEREGRLLLELRNRLFRGIMAGLKGAHLNGDPERRLENNLNLSIENVEGESLIMALDLEGVSASSGSACSSGSGETSHVLKALGVRPDLARGSLRLTLGRFTTADECDRAAEAVIRAVERLRRLSSSGTPA